MRFYNLEEVLLDDRVFVPADPEPRNSYGMPIVPEGSRALLRRPDRADSLQLLDTLAA